MGWMNMHEWEGVKVVNDELGQSLACNEHEIVGY